MLKAQVIKELREKTHAGILACKQALTKSNGDFELAMKLLRENGHIIASKKSSRIASDGIIAFKINNFGFASMLEINSETDFVAKNDMFINFAENINDVIINSNPNNIIELLDCKYNDIFLKDILIDKIMVLGENIKIKKFVRYDNNTFNVGYVHTNNNIGVLIGINNNSDILNHKNEIISLCKDICLQITSMNPLFLSKKDVDLQILENEKEILFQQAINEGKNKIIAEKIVLGRINKYYEENCLLEQPFIKDNTITINDYINNIKNKLKIEIEIKKFNRFEKGESINHKLK